jgi:YbgC/YbaW family acyl-CoA thioester hydrolase
LSKSSRWSEYRLRRRVHFHEVDSAGLVHFSNFFRYMEEAEHALWREAGLSIVHPGGDIGFPRVAAGFDFHRPLRVEEEFEVCVRVTAIGAKSIRYQCSIMRGDERIATGTLAIACVVKRPGEPLRAVPIPRTIADRFEVATPPDS